MYIYIYIYITCCMKVLHNLHEHSNFTQFFIFNLKKSRLFDCFNSTGTKSHIFGHKNDNDSVPWYTECTWRFSEVSFLRRLYEFVLDKNVSLRISGDKPRWILNFSVPKLPRFCNAFKQSCLYLAVLEMLKWTSMFVTWQTFCIKKLIHFGRLLMFLL